VDADPPRQVELYGEERSVATKLDFTHYEKVAEAVGAHGEYVEEPKAIRPALERALGCGKPALVNVRSASASSARARSRSEGWHGRFVGGRCRHRQRDSSGKVVDTNSPYVASELRALGVPLRASRPSPTSCR
jgi:hypothetical protein